MPGFIIFLQERCSMKQIYRTCEVKDMVLFYLLDEEKQIMGFTVLPKKMADRFRLDGNWKVESLI